MRQWLAINLVADFTVLANFVIVSLIFAFFGLISCDRGKIIEINEEIIDNPELVNSDPYGKGWMIKIEISNVDETKNLLDSKSYEKITG